MTDPGPIPPRFERFEGTEGLSLAADVLGDDDRPTVLLAHGGGQTRHAWGGAALALALRGWRAVSVDQRGHGDSDRSPEGHYLIGHFGADLRAVARGLNRPVAVGASLGGIASLIAEGESPEPVLRAVVLVDITPRVRPEGAARVVDFMKAHVETGFGSLEEAADAVAAYLPNRRRPRDLSGLRKNLREGADGRWYWHWDPAFVTDVRDRQEDRDPERLEACARVLARRRTPTLLVRGGSQRPGDRSGSARLSRPRAACPFRRCLGRGPHGRRRPERRLQHRRHPLPARFALKRRTGLNAPRRGSHPRRHDHAGYPRRPYEFRPRRRPGGRRGPLRRRQPHQRRPL